MVDENLLSGLSIDRKAQAPKSSNPVLLVLTLVFGASTLVLGYLFYTQNDNARGPIATPEARAAPVGLAPAPESTRPPEQSLARAPQNTGSKILDASGYVVAMRIATASSKTVGRIVEVLVEEGMEVEQGQVLARLDSETQLIQLELARARLLRSQAAQNESRARLREAELAMARSRRMAEANLLSQEELDNAEIRVDQINAEFDRQAAEIRIAQQEILQSTSRSAGAAAGSCG